MKKELTHDCGNPKGGYLKIGVWEGMPEMRFAATAALANMNFTNLDIVVMEKLVDVDQMERLDAAAARHAENVDRWRSWLPGST